MTILIWDLDWFYKKSKIPNPDCMRLSSFHKQKGNEVYLVNNEYDLTVNFGRLYIFRENEKTPVPPRKILDDARTSLMGKGFIFYGAKQISSVVTACRPDYLLYGLNNERSEYVNANFITFFNNQELIITRQDYHNTAKFRKKTLVTDDYLWDAPNEEIIICLDILKYEKNVAFLNPISLRKILSNTEIRQKFLSLHFSTGTIFHWRNDWSSEDIKPILDFMCELRKKTKSKLGFIPIKAVIHSQYEEELGFQLDVARCLETVAAFKKAKINCLLVPPKTYKNTPYLKIFNDFHRWTKYFPKLSYVEYVLHDICLTENVLWYNILNDPMRWNNHSIDFLLSLLSNKIWENYRNNLFVQWGTEELNSNKINFNAIQRNITLLYKDYNNE